MSWTQDEIVRLYQHLGLKIAHVAEIAPEREDSFIVVARKPRPDGVRTTVHLGSIQRTPTT
jgi:hypothetical protein